MDTFIGQLFEAEDRWLNWKSALAVALWGGLNVLALVVFGRWLVGALPTQPPTAEICAASALLALTGLTAYGLFRQIDFRGEHWSWEALPAFLTLFPLVVVVVIIPRGQIQPAWFAGTLGLFCAAVLFASETLSRRSRQPDDEQNAPSESEINTQLEQRLALSTADLGETEPTIAPADEEPWRSPEVSQWMTRSDSSDGNILLEGVAIATFAQGQKRSSTHLAFCPALPGIPQFECEPVDASAVRIKVGAVYPHGVRLDVTRSTSDQMAEQVAIGYFAHVEMETQATDAAA